MNVQWKIALLGAIDGGQPTYPALSPMADTRLFLYSSRQIPISSSDFCFDIARRQMYSFVSNASFNVLLRLWENLFAILARRT